MTQRLYYNDPYLREFDATVTSVATRDANTIVTLDQTAFYPTTGGQPFDTGSLDGRAVVDVAENEDGTVAHVLSGSAGSALDPGTRVHGTIDWDRRFDHMQQHTGQHVLSAAFDRLFRVRTVSFHLGAASSTIDLAREMTASELASAEDLANRVVWEDRPVSIRYADAEEAATLPLRKESFRAGTLRLIEVDGFDLSACGGTHVRRTGAIGVIAIAAWERFRGGQRIEFLCGVRALARFRSQRDVVAAAVRQLSVLPEELGPAIERLQAEAKGQKRSISGLQTELAQYRAGEMATSAETVRLPDGRTVQAVLRAVDLDAAGLKSLAAAVVGRPGFLVALVSTAKPALVVLARSADVPVAANGILTRLVSAFGGRGGGRPELAQGGGLERDPESILDAIRRDLSTAHQ